MMADEKERKYYGGRDAKTQAYVNKMTNHQNTAWMRDGMKADRAKWFCMNFKR